MGLCSFSSELIINNKLELDNIFVNEFLPYAPEGTVKVYIYGLYMCSHANAHDNTLESFAKVLSMSEQDILDSFLYWQEQGLVTVIETNPIEVRYLPVKNSYRNCQKYSKSKYASFNKEAQAIIEGRMITPNEYNEYYSIMESLHIEKTALIMIIKYCTMVKGSNVGYPYIITVAKNWAYEGITTAEQVDQKLQEMEQNVEDVREIIKLLGSKKQPSFEDKQMYLKWVKELRFEKEVIFRVAKMQNKKGGFEGLDSKLEKYYELQLMSFEDIQNFENNKQNLINLAEKIVRKLGLKFRDYESTIELYLTNWVNLGYDEESLILISEYAFKCNIHSLEGLNTIILKLHKLGVISLSAINEYIQSLVNEDKLYKEFLKNIGLTREVTNSDRDLFKTWINSWEISPELIKYACSLAVGKISPLVYVGKILLSWKEQNIRTVEQAKSNGVNLEKPKEQDLNFMPKSFSKEELHYAFVNLDEVSLT